MAFPAEGLFGGTATGAAVLAEREALNAESYDPATGALLLAVQSFVIRSSSRTILVDTGCGNGRSRPSARWCDMLETPWLDRLAAAGMQPEDVDAVVCTHLHVDHVGWNVRRDGEGWSPCFANATYIMGGEEYCWWLDEHLDGGRHSSPHQRAAFDECVQPLVAARRVEFVGSDEVIHSEPDLEISLEKLPGHTPHQLGVHVRSGRDHAFLIADAVHHGVQFVRRDWQGRTDYDQAMSRRTVDGLIERYADTDTIIIAAHAPWSRGARLARRGTRTFLLDVERAEGKAGERKRAAVA